MSNGADAIKRGRATRSLAIVIMAALSGCASGSMIAAAKQGDRPTLTRELGAAGAKGAFPLWEAADVAHAVVAHEIATAKTRADAVARIQDVRACAFAVDDVLSDRMDAGDSVAGEAALVRVEAGAMSDYSARGHAKSTDDSWRAVAMWGMTRSGDHDVRMHGLTDGSPLVRRSALHAIVEHDDGSEWPAVYEAARLDPDPLVRSTAVRALGHLSGAPPDLALRLRDLWEGADDGLRDVLAGVFSSPAVFKLGGKEALAHLLGTSSGNRAVTVAGVILGGRIDDATLRAEATAVLISAIKDGSHRVRIHALAVAPIHSSGHADETKAFVESITHLAQDEDLDVRVAALGRLAGADEVVRGPDRDHVIEALEAIGAPATDHDASLRGSRARLLLAEAGDVRIQAWVEQDLTSKDPVARLNAADALAALGRAARAAPLLADEDPSVRTRAACTLLLATRRR